MAPETELAERREPADLNPRVVVLVGLGTLGLVFATVGLCWVFEWLSGSLGPSSRPPTAFAPPHLQSDPAGELREYRAAEAARLAADPLAGRGDGMVRIPIERAKALIVARGTEAYAPLDPPRNPDPRR